MTYEKEKEAIVSEIEELEDKLISLKEKETIASDIEDLKTTLEGLKEQPQTVGAKKVAESIRRHILVLEAILKTDEILRGKSDE